ncbi:MAG: hypothetical protein ACC628_13285 [Pirellulaceae bacterium]
MNDAVGRRDSRNDRCGLGRSRFVAADALVQQLLNLLVQLRQFFKNVILSDVQFLDQGAFILWCIHGVHAGGGGVWT